MSQTWKTVRVFISSTFRDMRAERDYLVKRVFPALRQRLEPHRINLVDIDLRWGITREQADNDQVLGLCLQQIDECRPFFVGLLGGRYGWVPSKFPVEVGKRYGWTQHHTGKSVTELEILHGVLNDSAMHGRALFCFRSEDFLRDIKDEEKRRVYVEGPTDEELHELGPEEAERRAAVRRQQLADLKNGVHALSPPMPLFDGYPCNWDRAAVDPASKQPGRVGGLAELGNWILDKLERAILDAPELQEHLAAVRTETRDELAEERGFHERFIESRTRVYIGRQQLQDELKAFVRGAEPKPCLVTGPSGSGKSAALAKFCQLSTLNPQPSTTLIPHFVGASPRSTGLRDVLRHLCAELKDALKLEDEIKQDTRELSDQFREFLGKVPADRRVVLVIDALNQLDEADNAHSLYWLPGQIPLPVRLIVSCIDDPDRTDQPALAAMCSRQPHEIKVGLLTDEERLGIVREMPSVAAKTLDEQQVRLLLANEATRNPLFLLVALEELRGFGSFQQLNQKIASLPQTGDTLTAIFQQVIRRLGEDFNAATVKEVLTMLACARIGLSERELQELLSPNQKSGSSSPDHASRITHHDDLFPVLRQLRPYLQSRGPLLDFYHRHLAKATHEEFFKSDAPLTPSLSPSEGERVPVGAGEGRSAASRGLHGSGCPSLRLATHGRLADYFVGCAKGSDPAKEWETDGVRGFAECVFHLTKAERYDQAAGLLTNFPFLLHKLRVGLLEGVFEDYDILREEATAEVARQLEIWADFFREKAHILRRGNEEWPAHKILLQLAVEHADDSPLTSGAEKWLAEDRCNWLLFRRVQRLPSAEKNPCLAVLEGHDSYIKGALAMADGRLLSWSGDGTLRLWHSRSVRCLAVLAGHSDRVEGALALADGRLLSWSSDETLRLWDPQSSACLARLDGHTGSVAGALAFHDGRLLSWSEDTSLRMWDTQSGVCLAVLDGHTGSVVGALALPDGRLLSWSEDTSLRMWDTQSGVCLAVLDGHTGSVVGALALPDGRLLSWSEDTSLRMWDTQSGTCLTVMEGHGDLINGALTLADRRVLSWSLDTTLRIWDTQNGACLAVMEGHRDLVKGAFTLADGRLLSWSGDETLRLWDSQSGACLKVLAGHSDRVEGALALADGRLLSWSLDDTLRLWDDQSGACQAVLAGHTDSIKGALECADGRLLSWSGDRTLRLWGRLSVVLLDELEGHSTWVKGALPLADGRLLSWSYDGTLRLWDGPSGRCLTALAGHTGRVEGALALADGRLLSWAQDNTLRLWDGQSGACLQTLEGHTDWVLGTLALTDGRLLSWSRDRKLRLWDGQNGDCLAVLGGHTGSVVGALALADGRVLSWAQDDTLRLWDGQSGACLRALGGHTDWVFGALVLPDGRFLSWSADSTLRLWDSQSGVCLAVLEGHTGRVFGALALGGGRLLSWSDDKTLRLWDGRIGKCLEAVPEHQLARRHPEWLHVRAKARNSERVVSDFSVDSSLRSAHLRYRSHSSILAAWEADSDVVARCLLPNGTVVVTQDNGQVCILKLHHGQRIVSLAEVEGIFFPHLRQEPAAQLAPQVTTPETAKKPRWKFW